MEVGPWITGVPFGHLVICATCLGTQFAMAFAQHTMLLDIELDARVNESADRVPQLGNVYVSQLVVLADSVGVP